METLRREPFRLFFPLGVLLGWAGVLPWLLFTRGLFAQWPGLMHAFTMTQAFLPAVAAGFLLTMVPRRSGTPPATWWEMGLLVLGLSAQPAALVLGRVAVAEGCYALVLLTLGQFAARRFLGRKAAKPAPASFVLIPLSLVGATAGAALLAAGALWREASELAPLGRLLADEALLTGLVLALAPMLSPIILGGTPPADPPPARLGLLRLAHLGLGATLLASFWVQTALDARAGLALRAPVVLVELFVFGGLLAPGSAPGLHRRLYRLALALVPTGLVLAAIAPARRVPLEHVTFIGGFSLLVYAVSLHVTLLHTGRGKLASGSPLRIWAIALLTLAAAAVRINVERWSEQYFVLLFVAAALWLAGALVWFAFVMPMLTTHPPDEPPAA